MVWPVCTVIAMVALAKASGSPAPGWATRSWSQNPRATMVDALLAAILLGLGLHALLGWWCADPLASLVIVVYGVREGRHAWAEGAAYAFP
jgi:divalent metal cation (Fe/Co/Zn/Cd) transporter